METETKQERLFFLLNNINLTYTALVTAEDSDSITFFDRYNKKFTYSKKYLVSREVL